MIHPIIIFITFFLALLSAIIGITIFLKATTKRVKDNGETGVGPSKYRKEFLCGLSLIILGIALAIFGGFMSLILVASSF